MIKSNTIKVKRLVTVKQAASMYPAFSVASLRWLVFKEKSNGFSKVIRRLGRKVIIDLDIFEDWISEKSSID